MNYKITYKNKFNHQLFTKLNAGLLLVALVFSLAYVVLINQNTSAVYAIRDSQKHLADLKAMTEKMEMDVAELRSADYVKSMATNLGLVSTDRIQYIKADTGVALNR